MADMVAHVSRAAEMVNYWATGLVTHSRHDARETGPSFPYRPPRELTSAVLLGLRADKYLALVAAENAEELSVVKFMSDDIAVMNAGRIAEMGPAAAVYANPQQDYTRRLIAAIPSADLARIEERQRGRG